MKKAMMMMAAAMCITAPALAMSDNDMKMMNEKHFKMKDTNNDGMISKAEMMAASEKMMMDADMNKDGMMSMQEMADAKMKEHKMMMEDDDSMMMKR